MGKARCSSFIVWEHTDACLGWEWSVYTHYPSIQRCFQRSWPWCFLWKIWCMERWPSKLSIFGLIQLNSTSSVSPQTADPNYFICICVHVHMCMHMYAEARGKPQVWPLRHYYSLLKQGLSSGWSTPSRFGWLAKESKGSTYLCLQHWTIAWNVTPSFFT